MLYCILLLAIVLGSCGPAQDTPEDGAAAAKVVQREEIFNGAYENLDAAVIERLLAGDFSLSYAGQAAEKDKQQFVGELGQLRLVFPELRITIDSSRVTPYQDLFIVQGIRTFTWRANDKPGTYRERFTNRWRKEGGDWLLFRSKIDPVH